MASIFVVTTLFVALSVERIDISLTVLSGISVFAAVLLIGITIVTFYGLIVNLDDSHFGWSGAIGWAIAGGIYAVLLKASLLFVQDKFFLVMLAFLAFYVSRLLVFKVFSLVLK